MSGNLPFGFGVPSDPNEPGSSRPGTPGFDMSQMGAMLQQLGAMMQQQGTGQAPGTVNWTLVHDTARQAATAGGDPSVTDSERTAVREAGRLADVWLDAATAYPGNPGEALAWSRAEWIEATLPAWQRIAAPIAAQVQAAASQGPLGAPGSAEDLLAALPEELRAGLPPDALQMIGPMLGPVLGMMSSLSAMMFAAQFGQGIGALAGQVLGAGDIGIPLTSDGRPALLPKAVAEFGAGLGIADDEVRLYLALREAAHQRLFAHVPWLRGAVEGAIDAYARGIRVDPDRMQQALRQIDATDPAAMQAALPGLLTPEDSPEQRAALARLETLLALIEGWVDDVVQTAVAGRLPSADRLGEAIRRRRAAGGPAEKVFESLVGLELRPRRLREAATLWRLLREGRDIAGRDAVWAHPDLLPSSEDLDNPEAFVARD